MTAVGRWFQERIPLDKSTFVELTNEPVPNHLKRWWWCLGGTPAYLFVVQIVTGILLAFYYQAAPTTAYGSVDRITNELAFGWYLRSIHKWAATLMIAAVILHQMRIFFTRAYRKPREINWLIGMGLLMCTLLAGFTGYCLVFEQLSFWGATVGANITEQVPVVGGYLKQLAIGGDAFNSTTLSRFFIIHAAVLPVTMLVLLTMHISLIRLQGVTEYEFEDEPKDTPKSFNFFPDHFYTELAIGLFLMVLLTTLALVLPATMGPPADQNVTPDEIKPEWFFYPTFLWLKLWSKTVAILSVGFIVFVMMIWPFIDQFFDKRFPRYERANVIIGIIGTLALIGFTVYEALSGH